MKTVEVFRFHSLKCWPKYYAALIDGDKRDEVRLNDRHYKVGDVLVLQVSNVNPFTVPGPNNANTRLSAANHVLGANDTLVLIWGGGASGWVELAFANN